MYKFKPLFSTYFHKKIIDFMHINGYNSTIAGNKLTGKQQEADYDIHYLRKRGG